MNESKQQMVAARTPEGSVCVYCASSRSAPAAYRDAAQRLGAVLAKHNLSIIYGGGAVGSMGALADGALSHGGRVTGILPRFMAELEWGHPGLSELQVVDDMRSRKHLMLTHSAAVVALPGGCGTLEELLEALTLKRLGLYLNPIVLVNTRGFFDSFNDLMGRCIEEHFMDTRHRQMWQLVEEPEQVPAAIRAAPSWSSEARRFAAI